MLAYLKTSRSTPANNKGWSSRVAEFLMTSSACPDLTRFFSSGNIIMPQHRNAGSWNVSWGHGSVLRRMLFLAHEFLQMLISHWSSERWSTMPRDRRRVGDLKKASLCCSLSLSFSLSHWRFLWQPLHHCHTTIHWGTAPAVRCGPESYERAICSYKGGCQRRTWSRVLMYKCTNGLRSTCEGLWWLVRLILNSVKALRMSSRSCVLCSITSVCQYVHQLHKY